MIYLLDSDTLIFLIRGTKIAIPKNRSQKEFKASAARIRARCMSAGESGDPLGLSVISVAELEFGARHGENYKAEIEAINLILRPFVTFDFRAPECSRHYGEIRESVEREGRSMGAMELLIAAHARALNATLVSNNLAHFSRVPGLSCQNWA